MTTAHPDLVVVSYRGPVVHGRDESGRTRSRAPAGGLVSALASLPSLDTSTVWVCAALNEEDRAVALEEGDKPLPLLVGEREVRVRLTRLDPEAQHQTMTIAANPLLWFLQHGLWDGAHAPWFGHREHTAFHEGYASVSKGLAEAVVEELDSCGEDAVVMIHDYQLYLVGKYVRAARPTAFLHHFVHIPWPTPEAWQALPTAVAERLLGGLLSNDVVAFHTESYVRNFLDTCERLLSLPVDHENNEVVVDDRRVSVRWYPISVDPATLHALAASDVVQQERRALAAHRQGKLIVRVDRADPSKNVVRGFAALEMLLADHPEHRGEVTMLALIQPTRGEIEEYRVYLEEIRRAADGVNARFGTEAWQPVVLHVGEALHKAIAAYLEYDVLFVNAVRDGMNLVAKEGVLLNDREGVLVLSTQAGVYQEIGHFSLGVNPFDVVDQAEALHRALTLPEKERRERLSACREVVSRNDVGRWLDEQLRDINAARSGPPR